MDVERFERELPSLWNDFPHSERPREGVFERILDEVGGLACPNNLALLAVASACREPGESYVEVGAFNGASAIAAAHGCPRDLVAIDNFSMDGASRETLQRNLAAFGAAGVTVLEGDAFELLRAGALGDRRVGVYYYDGRHKYQYQLDGLRSIEPYLAERALLIVDDSDWEDVDRALRDYLAEQPRASELLRIDGKDRGRPHWWEGVAVLAWDASPAAPKQAGG